MSKVAAMMTFPGSVHEAQELWSDPDGWTAWVDGLETVVSVDGSWPEVGASAVWTSGPAGRGKVTERVVAFEPSLGQTVEVEDDAVTGTQSVTFIPVDSGVEVALELEYRIKKRSIFTPVVDLLFVRNAVRSSLLATLARFGTELDAAAGN